MRMSAAFGKAETTGWMNANLDEAQSAKISFDYDIANCRRAQVRRTYEKLVDTYRSR